MILVVLFAGGAASEFAVGHTSAGIVAITGPVVIILFAWPLVRFRRRPTRLEVTESMVLARQGWWRGQPDKQATRSEIRAIHYFPNLISFRGLDNKPLMMIQPHYTLAQMLKVAAKLDVRRYDHCRWLGLRRIDKGRLAYDPASDTALKSHR